MIEDRFCSHEAVVFDLVLGVVNGLLFGVEEGLELVLGLLHGNKIVMTITPMSIFTSIKSFQATVHAGQLLSGRKD